MEDSENKYETSRILVQSLLMDFSVYPGWPNVMQLILHYLINSRD